MNKGVYITKKIQKAIKEGYNRFWFELDEEIEGSYLEFVLQENFTLKAYSDAIFIANYDGKIPVNEIFVPVSNIKGIEARLIRDDNTFKNKVVYTSRGV